MKLFKGKRGMMELGGLYPFVVLLVLVAVLGGIAIVILSQLQSSDLIAGDTLAVQAVNESKYQIGQIYTVWFALIILVVVASILLIILIKNLAGRLGGR